MKSASTDILRQWLMQHGADPDCLSPQSALAEMIAGPRPDAACEATADERCERLRVLMLLCQKVGQTGSGIVVKEMIDAAPATGLEHHLICGGYAGDDPSSLFYAQPQRLDVVTFDSSAADGIPFPIAGMSNAMPYPSVPFKDLTPGQLERYLEVWRQYIRRAIQEHRPHIIHVHHLWLLAALAAMESPRLPVIVTVHGTDLFRADDSPHLASLVARWIHRLCRVLVLTGDAVTQVRSRYEVDPTRIEVFGNGYNPRLFRLQAPPRHSAGSGRDRFEDRRMVLCVGKFDDRKGIEWLIRAFAKLPGRERADVALVIAGSGPDSQRQRYLRIAEELGIGADIQLIGAVPYEQVGPLMNRACVFALAARDEPFGLVILEALACGCRVVTTDQAGPSWFVPQSLRESREAILVAGLSDDSPDPATAQAFVDRLTHALSEQLSRPLDSATRERIAASVKHMTWDAQMQRLVELYRRSLGEGISHCAPDTADRLAAAHAKLAARPDADNVTVNKVPETLPIRLIVPSKFEFTPGASLAIQSLVPRDSQVHREIEQVVAELRAAFPDISAVSYWQPPGTYHLNVAILQRLINDPDLRQGHARLVHDAGGVLDWLGDQPAYQIEFTGVVVTATGTIMTTGYPSPTACRIREHFQQHSFPDQQWTFHITLGRILSVLAPEAWNRFLTQFYARFASRPTGRLQVDSAILVSESKGFLHHPSHYTVLRTFRFGSELASSANTL